MPVVAGFFRRAWLAGFGFVFVVGMAAAVAGPDEKPVPAPAKAAPARPAAAPTPSGADVSSQVGPERATGDGDAGRVGVVTGSLIDRGQRIIRGQRITPSPVAVIDRDQIRREGQPTLGGLLRHLHENSNGIFVAKLPGGKVVLDLRHLGPGRSLVVMNGRRF